MPWWDHVEGIWALGVALRPRDLFVPSKPLRWVSSFISPQYSWGHLPNQPFKTAQAALAGVA